MEQNATPLTLFENISPLTLYECNDFTVEGGPSILLHRQPRLASKERQHRDRISNAMKDFIVEKKLKMSRIRKFWEQAKIVEERPETA